MRPLKTFLKSDRVRIVLCWIGAQYIRLVWRTGRWQVVNGEVPRAYWEAGKPFILSFWHGRILMMPYSWRRSVPIHMLISKHRDGKIIANTVSHFGIRSITGSSSRGGAAALRSMLKALKAGECVGITPDGPRGPRMRASEGIVQVARMSGAEVIPATYSVASGRVLRSWDRFLVALPFSRGAIVWGDPIAVPRDGDAASLESARRAIEDSLTEISRKADRMMNRETIDPAPETMDGAGGMPT